MKITLDKPLTCEGVAKLLSGLLFEELVIEEQSKVRAHLLSCEACSSAYLDFVASSLENGNLSAPTIPDPPPMPKNVENTDFSKLRESFAPGIDNAGDDTLQPLLSFQVALTRLAAAPRRLEEHSVNASQNQGENFVQVNSGGMIITLWEIDEENETLVGVKLDSGLRQKYEGKLVIIRDADNKQLLRGRFCSGEISGESEWKLTDIVSPLAVGIYV